MLQISTTRNRLKKNDVDQIVQLLQRGGVIAIPTETVYGLACSADHPAAVTQLIKIKQRAKNSGKFFTLVPENIKKAADYVVFNATASKLAKRHFPGPLTIILPKNQRLQSAYFEGLATIGIRIPNHPLFRQLLKQTGPLLLTSANRRGQPELSTASEIIQTIPELDAIIVGTPGNQPPSTIVDCTGAEPQILRQGQLIV